MPGLGKAESKGASGEPAGRLIDLWVTQIRMGRFLTVSSPLLDLESDLWFEMKMISIKQLL